MNSAIRIGLSGLVSASNQVQIASSNIVNANNTSRIDDGSDAARLAAKKAFQPQRAQQSPLAGGGVMTTAVPVKPSQLVAFSPGDPNANTEGLVNFPNVSLATEFVNLILAEQAFKASAALIRTADEIERTLIEDLRT
ncbi:MAG: flagellar basal body rod C-terminal domain-containing protein [Sphingomonadales bacterium]